MMYLKKLVIVLIILSNCLLLNAQQMETRYIEVNNETLAYTDKGEGEVTLLFLHGAFINKDYWSEQISYFSKNYRAVAVDLPGHGASTHSQNNWTGPRFGNDIRHFIQKLELKNVVIIGHSFGSDVMLETVANDASSILGLVEVDHMKNVGTELPKEAIDQIIKGLHVDFAATCEQFARQALVTEATDPKIVSRLLKDFKKMDPEVGIPLLKNGLTYATREVELLKALKLKLHMIHVNYTPTQEEPLQQYLGDRYELYILDGTCHYPMIENPKAFINLLERILIKIQER